jgi:5-methylthioadenosine/S-adenosylhomocysteine deaminase
MAFDSKISRRRVLGTMVTAGAVAGVGGMLPHNVFAQSVPRGSQSPHLPPQGEFIVKNAYILTMDETLGEIPNGDLHVKNGAIVAVGKNLKAPGAEVIRADNMILIPGMIETHWHMWGAVARNMAGPTKESGYYFLSRLLGQFFTPEDNARGVRLALAEGLSTGITTFNNWSHNLLSPEYADAELAVHKEVGARARFSYGYSRKTAPEDTLPLTDVERVQKQYFNGGNITSDGLLTLGIACRGPENNSLEICQKEWDFARSHKIHITSHMGTDADRVQKRQGVQTLAKANLLGPDVLLIHETNNSPEDLKLLAETKTPVSMSPFTELRTGFGITPVGDFLKAGVPVSLSVDTTILAGGVDMFAIMKAIENIEDGRTKNEYGISPQRILEMATIDGARALGIDDQVGSLKPGKRADFVLLRTTDINMIPFTVAARMIVQAAQPANVEAVAVDGRFLKRRGKLTTVDLARLRRDSADTIARARQEASKPGAGEGIGSLFTAH